MLQHRARLIDLDTGKPVEEVAECRAIFDVLEKSRDRYARTFEHPSATYSAGVTFYRGAGGPIDHGKDGSTGAHIALPTFLNSPNLARGLFEKQRATRSKHAVRQEMALFSELAHRRTNEHARIKLVEPEQPLKLPAKPAVPPRHDRRTKEQGRRRTGWARRGFNAKP